MKFSKNVNNKKCATKLNFFNENFFWKLQFLKHLKHFLLKLCPFFVSWFWSSVMSYEFDLRVIFDQWPKLHLGLDMRPEIPILKGLYYISREHSLFWKVNSVLAEMCMLCIALKVAQSQKVFWLKFPKKDTKSWSFKIMVWCLA